MLKREITLNVREIDSIIDELEAYRESLDGKLQVFVQELSKIGLDVINNDIIGIPPEEKGSDIGTSASDVTVSDGTASMYIYLKGKKVLFIEFSAGVTFGTANYPLESGSEYGALTYPGQTHASNPDGWYYTNENGEPKQHTYGNRAYMPMYHSTVGMRMLVEEIAQRIFGS